MIIRVKYGQSIKDGKGNLHTYNAEVETDIDESTLTKEQKPAKIRQIQAFLHNEIHGAIERQQIQDGLLDPAKATHAKNGGK